MTRSIFSDDEDDGQILFYFLFELHKDNRHSDFKKELDLLIQEGVDIYGADMLNSILYLLSRAGGTEATEDILKMFKIALFDYRVFDDIAESKVENDDPYEDCYAVTTVDYIRVQLFEDFGTQVDEKTVDRVREYIFEYVLMNFDKHAIQNLSLDKQHKLLLTQFPFYDNVKTLMRLGCKYDRTFDYGKCYTDVFHYISNMVLNENYGICRDGEIPRLYAFLALIFENKLDADIDKAYVYQVLQVFKDCLHPNEIEGIENMIEDIINKHAVNVENDTATYNSNPKETKIY